MALIGCPECKKEISERAPNCIYCGFPLSKEIIADIKEQAERKERERKEFLDSLVTGTIKNRIIKQEPKKYSKKFTITLFAFVGIISLIMIAIAFMYDGKNVNSTTNMAVSESNNKIESYAVYPTETDNDEYIIIIKDEVNIRFLPNSNSFVVAKGMKNDVFKLLEEKDEWFVIDLFTGEYRYVSKLNANKVDTIKPYLLELEVKTKAYKELVKVEDKASAEAMIKYPNNLDKEIEYARILEDRYKLAVFRKYSILVPWQGDLIVEGTKNRWLY